MPEVPDINRSRAAIDIPGPGPTLQRYADAVARLARP